MSYNPFATFGNVLHHQMRSIKQLAGFIGCNGICDIPIHVLLFALRLRQDSRTDIFASETRNAGLGGIFATYTLRLASILTAKA